jgi:hypothetical protein
MAHPLQSYVNYLIEDIKNAERPEVPYQQGNMDNEEESLEEHFAEIERWIEHEPETTFSQHSGLKSEQFPPAEKLNVTQLRLIIKCFKKLLYSWNLDASIPDKLPPAKYYTLLISVLDKKTDIFTDGCLTIEFCEYDTASCPFGEFCECKDFEADDMTDFDLTNRSPDDLPF